MLWSDYLILAILTFAIFWTCGSIFVTNTIAFNALGLITVASLFDFYCSWLFDGFVRFQILTEHFFNGLVLLLLIRGFLWLNVWLTVLVFRSWYRLWTERIRLPYREYLETLILWILKNLRNKISFIGFLGRTNETWAFGIKRISLLGWSSEFVRAIILCWVHNKKIRLLISHLPLWIKIIILIAQIIVAILI